MPYNDMGDPKNITEKHFQEAGQTKAIGQAGVKQAKQHMIELLKAELDKDQLDKPGEKY